MVKNKKRLTIGLLVSGMSDEFTMSICKGAVRKAKEFDVNLVVFPGKYLNRDLSGRREIMYEYQYNTIFSYARRENIDALIVSAGSIGCYTTEERIREMMAYYEGIPCILVASKLDGYVSVNYDNDKGIREGMEYLIHNMNCKKFCMIGGPDNNTDAYERKRTFLNVLETYGIPFQNKTYVQGDLTRHSSGAYQELLDNNPDMEAVFCVNDDTAIGFYDEMKKRGLVPGRDIMVFGYDNVILGAHSKPSLSSVWANPVELGERAFENVIRMINGEKVESEVLPTKFIRRSSFGEVSVNIRKTQNKGFSDNDINNYFDNIFYRYKHEDFDGEMPKICSLFKAMTEEMFRLSERPEPDAGLCINMLDLLDEFLNYDALEYADVDNMLIYFEQIYHELEMRKTGMDYQYRLKEIFTVVYKKIIRAMDHRFGSLREEKESTDYSMKLFVRDILQFEKGDDQSYTMLLGNLGWLNVKNAYVYVFEEPIMHLYQEKFLLPSELYLKAVLKGGVVQKVPSIHQRKSVGEIYCNDDMNQERYSMVLLPLFSNEILYGIALCDLSDRMFDNGEFLANQMSSAVKMIELLKTNEEIQLQLEENLVTLRENNIALDNLSKSDGLTGIFNRRGFYDAADKLVGRNQKDGKSTLAAYIDMNNLKIINDRYGHEEGDFSLKLIGDVLVSVIGKAGIAGRIGGDEFACVIEYEKQDDGRDLIETIHQKFASYNEESLKPYNITVSVGTYILRETDKLDLKEALTLADEKLYEAKQHRVKNVAKEEFREN